MSEAKDLVVVAEQPSEEPPPPPSRPAPRPPEPDFAERVMLFVELRPWLTALIVFAALAALHVVLLDIAGVASGLYVGDTFLPLAGSNPIEIVLLAFVAYSVVFPTLLGHSAVRAYDALRPSLMLDDRGYGEIRAGIADPFLSWRFWGGLGSAGILTPPIGSIISQQIPGEGAAHALLAIWMYVRLALIFGLPGANIIYVVALHRRFRAVTAEHLRIDLFDLSSLRPIVRYGRYASLYFLIPVALIGPAVVRPEALVQVAVIFAILVILAGTAVIGALWGARKSIRAAKAGALTELAAYARELWRRAYAGQRIVEAVAIAPLGAMITVRNDIRRIDEWPGGWSVFTRFLALVSIPLLAWFGPEIAERLLDALGR